MTRGKFEGDDVANIVVKLFADKFDYIIFIKLKFLMRLYIKKGILVKLIINVKYQWKKKLKN